MGSPSERTLEGPLRAIRLHDPRLSPLDPSGARLYGGRWNSPGADIVYASLTYAGALLEIRVHAMSEEQPPREIAVITVPAGVRVAELTASDVHGWDSTTLVEARAAGDAWIADAQTLALIVPSKPGAPLERNIALNLAHPDATKLRVESLGPVPWDVRLFVQQAPRAQRGPAPRKKK